MTWFAKVWVDPVTESNPRYQERRRGNKRKALFGKHHDFRSSWSTTSWQWQSLRSGTDRFAFLHMCSFLIFSSSGLAAMDEKDKERRRGHPKVETLNNSELITLFSQVHWSSVWAARLPDPPARVGGALRPGTWGSWPGDRAGGVLDRVQLRADYPFFSGTWPRRLRVRRRPTVMRERGRAWNLMRERGLQVRLGLKKSMTLTDIEESLFTLFVSLKEYE